MVRLGQATDGKICREDSGIVAKLGQATDGKIRRADSGKKYFLPQNVQTGSEAQLISYSMCTEGPFPEVKWSELEADHTSSSNSEGKNEWSCTPTPP